MVICAAASFLFSYSPPPPNVAGNDDYLKSPSFPFFFPPFLSLSGQFLHLPPPLDVGAAKEKGERDGGKGVEGEEIDLRDESFSFRRRRPRAREKHRRGDSPQSLPISPPPHPLKKIRPHSCASHFRHVLEHGGEKGQKTMTKARK